MPLPRRRFLRLLWPWAAALALHRHDLRRPMIPRYPVSDHYDGTRFFNPGENPRGFRDLIRWQRNRKPGLWPAWIENRATPRLPAAIGPGEGAVTFVNHATFLLQFAGLNVLTDPIWSERCSPVSWAGPRRRRAPGLAFGDLPRIDVVLLSHNHYDHLDRPTLRRLHAAHRPLVITPLGNQPLLAASGLDRVVELDWWQSCEPRPGVRVTVTPAQHFAARGLDDRMRTLWGGFMLEAGGGRVWFAGDTGYFPGFGEIGRRLGAPDLALLPIGAYEPRWFMGPVHCTPAEAIRAHRDVGARRSLAMHFGCFPLADDGYQQPIDDFLTARAAERMPEDEFALPEVGETRLVRFGV
ncbi:MAG TPA: MBL fold metallo-hydrolase [Opitutaceae bacterium]|nr:MBL fold metallo-hydrolase [Opitutaceae bacterium]